MSQDVYKQFNIQLKERLSLALPGIAAQAHMAPPQRFPKNHTQVYKPNTNTRIGCVLLLLYPDQGQVHFPLIVRPEYEGVHSGQVALPGGKKDEDDEDFIATALRETSEEIGVDVERTSVLGRLSELYIPPSNFIVHPIVAAIDNKPTFNPDEREVAKMITVDLMSLRGDAKREVKEVQWKGQTVNLPFYNIDNHTVWGATAMILGEFLTIIDELQLSPMLD